MHIITYPSYLSNATLKTDADFHTERQNTFLHCTNYCSLKNKKIGFIKPFCSLIYFQKMIIRKKINSCKSDTRKCTYLVITLWNSVYMTSCGMKISETERR